MGFAPVAATAILLVATFQVLGGTVPTMIDADARLDEARDDAWTRERLLTDMAVSIDAVSSGSGSTQVTATNVGDEAIRLLDVVLVLDGTPASPGNWTVDGMTTDFWLPGEAATIAVASGSHQHIALNLPTGAMVHWGS